MRPKSQRPSGLSSKRRAVLRDRRAFLLGWSQAENGPMAEQAIGPRTCGPRGLQLRRSTRAASNKRIVSREKASKQTRGVAPNLSTWLDAWLHLMPPTFMDVIAHLPLHVRATVLCGYVCPCMLHVCKLIRVSVVMCVRGSACAHAVACASGCLCVCTYTHVLEIALTFAHPFACAAVLALVVVLVLA